MPGLRRATAQVQHPADQGLLDRRPQEDQQGPGVPIGAHQPDRLAGGVAALAQDDIEVIQAAGADGDIGRGLAAGRVEAIGDRKLLELDGVRPGDLDRLGDPILLHQPADDRAVLAVDPGLDAGAVKDDYVLEYDWDGDRQVTWNLVKGQMQKRQEGSYTLVETDGRTEVTYKITIDLSIPMLGMIKRRAEKVILDTALKELKKRVEG